MSMKFEKQIKMKIKNIINNGSHYQSFVQKGIGVIYKTAINLYFYNFKAFSCSIPFIYLYINYYFII